MIAQQAQIQITVPSSDAKLLRERTAMLRGDIQFDKARLKTITELLACTYICELKNQLPPELLEQTDEDDQPYENECFFAAHSLDAREHQATLSAPSAIQS